MVVLKLMLKNLGKISTVKIIKFLVTVFKNFFLSASKKEEEVKKLKEKVSDIVHQEDKTKQAKLK